MNSDQYRTIKGNVEAKLVRKGSRFIALAQRVASEDELGQRLAVARRRYHDATHLCYAYRLHTRNGIVVRAHDAGEPAGSAGAPILQLLEGTKLLNVLVIVVRYYGGTKLGIGGLARAYSDAAKEALGRAEVITELRRERLLLRFPPEFTGKVIRLVNQYEAQIEHLEYAQRPRLTVALPPSQREAFLRALADATSDRVEFLAS